MTSRAKMGEAGGAGVGATPPVSGWTENIYEFVRILVFSEDASRLDFVSSRLLAFGYSVTSITSRGLALEMLMKPNAFHIIAIDDSVKDIFLKKWFSITKLTAENVCNIIFTSDYSHRNAKLYLDQGALLVVPYDKIESFYSILWQFILVKNKFNSELRILREQRIWSAEAKTDFEYAIQFAGPDRRPSSVNSQAVGNYMRKTNVPRTGALGAGPSIVAQLSYLEQLAQAEAGQSVAQPSSFLGAGATDEGSRDPVLDTGDTFMSDLDFFQDFTQD